MNPKAGGSPRMSIEATATTSRAYNLVTLHDAMAKYHDPHQP